MRRLRVRKLPDHAGTGSFRVNPLTTSPRVEMVFPPQRLDGALRVSHGPAAAGPWRLWMLLPEGRDYEEFRLIRYPTDTPEKVQGVDIATEYLAEDSTILLQVAESGARSHLRAAMDL